MRGPETQAVIVNPEIGGGHRYFGQLVEGELKKGGLEPCWVSVPDAIPGRISFFYWRLAQLLYKMGGRGGLVTEVYERLRQGSEKNSFFLGLAQNELRQSLVDHQGVIISTHAQTAVKTHGPLLVIQGDLYGGRGYAVRGADFIVVPTNISRDELLSYGFPSNRIEEVGFFVDQAIKDPEIIGRRLQQLEEGRAHIGIFFTGALPKRHVQFVQKELLPSLVPFIKEGKVQVTIYTFTSLGLLEKFLEQGKALGLSTVWGNVRKRDWGLRVIAGRTPREAIERSLRIVGDQENPISVLVTMAGERISWAAGLALVPLPPINQTTAGGNTRWGMENELFGDPKDAGDLVRILETKEGLLGLAGKIKRGQKLINPNGAESTAEIVQGLIK